MKLTHISVLALAFSLSAGSAMAQADQKSDPPAAATKTDTKQQQKDLKRQEQASHEQEKSDKAQRKALAAQDKAAKAAEKAKN